MNAGPLRASIFTLYERSPPTGPRDLWLEIANDLEDAIPERYQALSGRPYRLRINDTVEHSPSKRYVRYRTLNVSLRLKRDAPALLDVCLGNWVFLASDLSDPLSTAEVPETGWIRSTTSVSLSEHVRWIREFLTDLEEAGWQTSDAVLTPLELRMPSIETGQGVRSYDPAGLSRIASRPLWRPSRLKIGVLVLDNLSTSDAVVDRIIEAWQRIFRCSAPPISASLTAPLADDSSATLVVIPDGVDLIARADLCALLQQWECEGRRFKLTRQSTTTKSYPMQNICFDLSVLAGSVPWRPAIEAVPAVSFDAGHDVKQRKSRWASAAMDSQLKVSTLRVMDTSLAEHMPEEISAAFWPTNPLSMVMRDGRLAREREILDERAVAEHRVLWGNQETSRRARLPREFGRGVCGQIRRRRNGSTWRDSSADPPR